MRYYFVYADEKCLFFFSVWGSGPGNISTDWPYSTRSSNSNVCYMLSAKGRTVEQRESAVEPK